MTGPSDHDSQHQEARQRVLDAVAALLAGGPPTLGSAGEFLGRVYDAGLADVSNPVGYGGLGLPGRLQRIVLEALYEAGAPSAYFRNPIGVGHAAPTLVAFAGREQLDRYLRRIYTAEDIWCQLFSEPSAGSDLAGLSTRATAVAGGWRIDGQKVWTSLAHVSRYGMLLARTDPTVPKHKGLTYFIADMQAPGVTVRPLRQMTGDAEFNEVFLDDVFLPDEARLGPVNEGWRVAVATLMSERVAMGGTSPPRNSGLIGEAIRLWRAEGTERTESARDRLVELWLRVEAQRLTNLRAQRNQDAAGPEGSIGKLNSTETNMAIYDLIFELIGQDGALFESYDRPRTTELTKGAEEGGLNVAGTFTDVYEKVPGGRPPMTGADLRYGFLRSRANGIEAGTSEILRNVLAERVLGLPKEHRSDTTLPWRDVPRGTRA